MTKVESESPRGVPDRPGLSQTQFAKLLGMSTVTLRNWEEGRREPRGAAAILIRPATRHPETVE